MYALQQVLTCQYINCTHSKNIRILLHAGLVRIRNAPELPLSLPLLAVTVLRVHSVFMDPNFRLVRRYNKTRRFTHVSEDDSPRVGDRQMILGDVRDVREETEQLLGPA